MLHSKQIRLNFCRCVFGKRVFLTPCVHRFNVACGTSRPTSRKYWSQFETVWLHCQKIFFCFCHTVLFWTMLVAPAYAINGSQKAYGETDMQRKSNYMRSKSALKWVPANVLHTMLSEMCHNVHFDSHLPRKTSNLTCKSSLSVIPSIPVCFGPFPSMNSSWPNHGWPQRVQVRRTLEFPTSKATPHYCLR